MLEGTRLFAGFAGCQMAAKVCGELRDRSLTTGGIRIEGAQQNAAEAFRQLAFRQQLAKHYAQRVNIGGNGRNERLRLPDLSNYDWGVAVH